MKIGNRLDIYKAEELPVERLPDETLRRLGYYLVAAAVRMRLPLPTKIIYANTAKAHL